MQMPSADAAAAAGRAGWRWPGEIGSIGSRCTLVRAAVAGDPGGAGVDDVPDARARSATSRRRWWPARSGGRCAARRRGAARRRTAGRRAAATSVSRQRQRAAARRRCRGSRARRSRNTRMSPGALGRHSSSTASTIASVWSRSIGSPSSSSSAARQRAVADLDRVGAAGDLDDRRRLPPVGEVLGEALGVDGRRGDDQLEVGPARQQLLEVAEQEVDVEAALVRLVDDDRVVAAQRRGRAAARRAGCRRSSP